MLKFASDSLPTMNSFFQEGLHEVYNKKKLFKWKYIWILCKARILSCERNQAQYICCNCER